MLYLVGMGLKQAQAVKDKYIPADSGLDLACVLAAVYVVASLSAGQRAGDCDGGVYGNCLGDFGGWIEQITSIRLAKQRGKK